jgi:hypothetical protein
MKRRSECHENMWASQNQQTNKQQKTIKTTNKNWNKIKKEHILLLILEKKTYCHFHFEFSGNFNFFSLKLLFEYENNLWFAIRLKLICDNFFEIVRVCWNHTFRVEIIFVRVEIHAWGFPTLQLQIMKKNIKTQKKVCFM